MTETLTTAVGQPASLRRESARVLALHLLCFVLPVTTLLFVATGPHAGGLGLWLLPWMKTRLEGISDRSRMLLEDLEAKKWNEISANVEAYITSVSELDDNDNILNIYTRLLKSKALASSVQNRKRVLSGLKKAPPSYPISSVSRSTLPPSGSIR